MSNKVIYKIIFVNHEKMFEIYATELVQSSMIGFVEIGGIVFGEKSGVLIDPAEEKLKAEFHAVEKTYIPIHSIIRIDEVTKQGVAKIVETDTSGDRVLKFPAASIKNDSAPKDK